MKLKIKSNKINFELFRDTFFWTLSNIQYSLIFLEICIGAGSTNLFVKFLSSLYVSSLPMIKTLKKLFHFCYHCYLLERVSNISQEIAHMYVDWITIQSYEASLKILNKFSLDIEYYSCWISGWGTPNQFQKL